MEIRPTPAGVEYLEAVVDRTELETLTAVLRKHLGPPAKEPGKEAKLPEEIQRTVDALGGLRLDQSFYYKREKKRILFAALWPWASNPDKVTLKAGVSEIHSA